MVPLSPGPDDGEISAPNTAIARNHRTVGDRELEIKIRADCVEMQVVS
jgi:hypothetical protein